MKRKDPQGKSFIAKIKRNMVKPALSVAHAELLRFGDSPYKSVCPACETGVLLMQRAQVTFELAAEDHCLHCGRRFCYTDINNLRQKEKGKT